MTVRIPPQCLLCTHFRSPLAGAPEQTCDAYPDGIPDGIWNNHVDHREPQPGDHGITWESSDGKPFPDWILDDGDGPDAEGPMEDDAEAKARRSRQLAMLDTRALGHDVTPGHDELHHFWTVGKGRREWVDSPKPWTTLVALLTKHVGPEKAKVYASRWFIEVKGYAAGSDLNRVAHGHPPRGNRVGPG